VSSSQAFRHPRSFWRSDYVRRMGDGSRLQRSAAIPNDKIDIIPMNEALLPPH
jgi:hypothetical protein